MALPPKWYQFLIGVFASLGSYLFGYDLGVIAEVVASKTFLAKFTPDDTQSGLVVSMFTTGAFFGASAIRGYPHGPGRAGLTVLAARAALNRGADPGLVRGPT